MALGLMLVVFSVLLLIINFSLHIFQRKKKQQNCAKFPPGPSPLLSLPLIGHGYLLGKNPVKKLLQCNAKYGPMFRMDMGNVPTVFLCNFELILEASKAEVCSGRSGNAFAGMTCIRKLDSTGAFGGVSFSSGQIWQEQRKFMLRQLTDLGMSNKAEVENLITEEAEHIMLKLKTIAMGGKKKMSMRGQFHTGVNSVLWRMLLKGKETKETEVMTSTVSKFFELLSPAESLLSMLQLTSATFMRLCSMLGVPNLMDVSEDIDRLAQLEVVGKMGDINGDFMERYLAEIGRNEGNLGSSFHGENGRVNLIAQLSDFLMAGTDIVSNFLEWCILYMCQHSEVQEQLHTEIKSSLGLKANIMLVDQSKLPMVMATIEEICRHCPEVAFGGIPHQTTDEFEIGGYTLPKGTQVIFLSTAVAMDKKLFTNPEEFNPARFLDSNGNFARNEHSLFFGRGKRKCIGERLAKAELFLFFANLMQKFKFEKADDVLDFAPICSMVLFPRPFQVFVEERK